MARKVAAAAPTSTIRRTVVAIGSRNRAKVGGVRRIFIRFFQDVEFKELDLTARVKIQPMTLDETVKGARQRAEFSIKKEGADFGVGVEAGIIKLAEENKGRGFFLNVQVAAIVDSAHHLSFGLSSGFPIPPSLVTIMEGERAELDRYARELTGAKTIREEHGVVYHLSKRRLSRVEMTEQCVSMALIPWLNKGTFEFG
jgi:inosine/xanthosine triphosphatase